MGQRECMQTMAPQAPLFACGEGKAWTPKSPNLGTAILALKSPPDDPDFKAQPLPLPSACLIRRLGCDTGCFAGIPKGILYKGYIRLS